MVFDLMNNTIDFRSVPDELWVQIEPLLSQFCRTKSGGSKPNPQRFILAGILYKCRTGCQWAMIPRCYGSKSSIHEHFQRWTRAGIFDELFRIILKDYAEHFGLDPEWQAMDGTLIQSPVRNKKISIRRAWTKSNRPRKNRKQTSPPR